MKKTSLFILSLLLLTATSSFGQFKLYEKGHDSYTAGKYDEAITLFSEYLTKTTRDKALDVEVFYLRGLSYFKKADYKNAIGDFEECLLRNHANKGNILWFKAKCHVNLGTLVDAADDYTNAIAALGGDNAVKSKLLLERGTVYKKTGDLDLAALDFQEGLRLVPGNADLKKELDSMDPRQVEARAATRKTEAMRTVQQTPPQTTPQQNTSTDEVAKVTPDQKQPDKKATGGTLLGQQKARTEKKTDVPETAPTTAQQTNSPGTNSQPAGSNDVAKGKTDNTNKKVAGGTLFGQQKAKTEKKTEEIKPEVVPPVTTQATQANQPTLADLYKDEKRYALVIGNSNYPKSIGVLRNPVNDATDLAKELQASNFEVQLLTNATYGQMRAAMLKFKEKIDAGDKDKTVSLFYFAGHGLQYEDENFLVPVDAMIEYQDDISRYCFGVQKMVLANMERSNSRMNIVILDACRNNPFPALTRSMGDQGLGEMRRARGSFIAYATAPGSVASDGTGRNGLYTQELLKAMRKPGLTIEQVFKQVRANVLKLSGDKQNTWDSSNITGEFYFKF